MKVSFLRRTGVCERASDSERFYVVSMWMWNGACMRKSHSHKSCRYALCSCLHHKTCFDVQKL